MNFKMRSTRFYWLTLPPPECFNDISWIMTAPILSWPYRKSFHRTVYEKDNMPLYHWYSIRRHNNHIIKNKQCSFQSCSITCFSALLHSQCNKQFIAPYFTRAIFLYIIWKLRAKPLTWNSLWFQMTQLRRVLFPSLLLEV